MAKSFQSKFVNILKLKAFDCALKLSNIVFKEAKTPKELNEVFRIRYEVYLEKGYIKENKNKLFTDKYDSHSVSFLASKNGRSMGSVRLVLHSKKGFPTEHLFNFERPDIPGEKIAEISRLVIKKEYRGGNRIVMMGLMKILFEYAKKMDIEYLYANMPEKLKEYYSSFGLELEELLEQEPTLENLKARGLIGGYFEKKILKPYLLDIKRGENKFKL